MNKALRILALATDAFGAGGGIAQYNRDLFGALSSAGNINEVVVLPRKGQVLPGDLPAKVIQLPLCKGKLSFSLRALQTVWRHGPFDLIFCGHLYMTPLVALISKISGIPFWLQLHGIEAWERPGVLQRWGAERADLVTAVSRYTRRRFLSWANCKPEMVKVLPNTVDERFSPGPKPESLTDRYQLRGKKVLLTVSRLAAAERYKGHDRVIEAVAELKKAHPEIVYMIAGDGDDMPRLQKLANDFGVAEQVRFIGYVPDEDLPDLYRTADVFVMPSTGEGFGIVFLQALASGIPVIGGDSDGSRDPLRDGLDGHLVEANKPAVMAVAIDEIIRGEEMAHSTTKPFVREHYQGLVARLVGDLPHNSTQPAVL